MCSSRLLDEPMAALARESDDQVIPTQHHEANRLESLLPPFEMLKLWQASIFKEDASRYHGHRLHQASTFDSLYLLAPSVVDQTWAQRKSGRARVFITAAFRKCARSAAIPCSSAASTLQCLTLLPKTWPWSRRWQSFASCTVVKLTKK